jgi:4-hydroxybenzoate polyprenyltransferase/phosphoserine phosphatase
VSHSSATPRSGAPTAPASDRRALCVDLDGTLLATDSLHELVLALARERPFDLLRLPLWLARGRAALKARLGERVQLDPALLPYRPEVLEALREARAEGRACVLVTAADRRLAESIAGHVGLFDEVLGSDGRENLKGHRKAERLVARFGARGFEYLGDAAADLPVWEAAGSASLVAAGAGLRRRVTARVPVARSLAASPAAGARLRAWARALRLHQWVKNLLLLLPLFASHRFVELPLLARAGQAFLAFGLCASAVYLLNDLSDLPSDRAHPARRGRPFARGALPPAQGVVAAVGLLAAGLALAARLPSSFLAAVLAYLAANVAYSLALKRVAVADVVLLAGLYTLRVVAGASAVGVPLSPWLLAFCLFFFLNLAFLKRYVDVRRVAGDGTAAVPGRDYRASDLPLLAGMGLAAGYLAVVVLALYVQSDYVVRLYRAPDLLWLATLLVVYWTSRAWLLAHRGELHDDPVVFALRDPVTWGVGAAGLAVAALATFA